MTNRKLNVKDVAYISVLAALCVLATFIKIPFGSGAMAHLGTGMVFTSGILFGGVYAGWAAAIGSAFYDLLLGFSPYTFWSFFINLFYIYFSIKSFIYFVKYFCIELFCTFLFI